VAATGSGQTSVEMRYEDENIWLIQKMMATLYDVTIPAINQHLKRIFADSSCNRDGVHCHAHSSAQERPYHSHHSSRDRRQ
jgi:hypothetical protein